MGKGCYYICAHLKKIFCAYHTLACIKRCICAQFWCYICAYIFTALPWPVASVFNKVLALISLFTEIERYVDADGKTVLHIDYEHSYSRLWFFLHLNQPTELVESGNCVVKSITE